MIWRNGHNIPMCELKTFLCEMCPTVGGQWVNSLLHWIWQPLFCLVQLQRRMHQVVLNWNTYSFYASNAMWITWSACNCICIIMRWGKRIHVEQSMAICERKCVCWPKGKNAKSKGILMKKIPWLQFLLVSLLRSVKSLQENSYVSTFSLLWYYTKCPYMILGWQIKQITNIRYIPISHFALTYL